MINPKILLLPIALAVIIPLQARAQTQVTNLIVAPPTILENLETTTGQVVIKSTQPVGSVFLNGAVINIVCKEDVLPSSNRKEHGIYVGVSINGQAEVRTVIDFDELDSLIRSIDYLSGVTWSVTSLSSFNASYTTKAGLHVAAYSSKRSGQIEFSLRKNNYVPYIDLKLTPEQRSEFRALLDQARTKLIALRNG